MLQVVRGLASSRSSSSCSLLLVVVIIATTVGAADANELVFCNTLESEEKLFSSDIGLAATNFTGGEFVDDGGLFGRNAYRASFNWNDDGNNENSSGIAFPKEIIPAGRGTIEFWFKLEKFRTATNLNRRHMPGFFLIDDGEGGRAEIDIGYGTNDAPGGGFTAKIGALLVSTSPNLAYPNPDILNYTDLLEDRHAWHHYAVAWDKDGLHIPDLRGTGKIAQWLDGSLLENKFYDDWSIPTTFPAPVSGEVRFIKMQLYPSENPSVHMSTLRIWDYARTEAEINVWMHNRLTCTPPPTISPSPTISSRPSFPPTTSHGPTSLQFRRLNFCNTLSSEDAIWNGVVGPGAWKYNSAGEFVSDGGLFGTDSIRVSSDEFVELTFPSEIISADRGTIEFWFKLTDYPGERWFQLSTTFFSIDDDLGGKYAVMIEAGHNGAAGFVSWIGNLLLTSNRYLRWVTFDDLLGDRHAWHHYAVSWDIDGLNERSTGGTGKHLQWIDGKRPREIFSGTSASFPAPARYSIRLFPANEVEGAQVQMSTIKIWNYAKTEEEINAGMFEPCLITPTVSPNPTISEYPTPTPTASHSPTTLLSTHLLFCNTLESEAAIRNGIVGPGAKGFNGAGEFVSDDGLFGKDALRVDQDEYMDLRFSREIIPTKRGTIEFWAKLVNFPPRGVKYPRIREKRTVYFRIRDYPSGCLCEIAIGDARDGGIGGWSGGLMSKISNLHVYTHYGRDGEEANIINKTRYEEILGNVSAWHHYAVAWDVDGMNEPGLSRAGNLVQWVDGKRLTEHVNGATADFRECNGDDVHLFYERTLKGWEGYKLQMSTVKIWDYAKTEGEIKAGMHVSCISSPTVSPSPTASYTPTSNPTTSLRPSIHVPRELLFCNTLENKEAIMDGIVGPGAKVFNGNSSFRDDAGLFGRDSIRVRTRQDLVLKFSRKIIPADRGTIEFWVRLVDYVEQSWDFTALFSVDDGKGGRYKIQIVAGLNSLIGNIGVRSGRFRHETKLNELLGNSSAWHHYAVAWDIDGLREANLRGTGTLLHWVDGQRLGEMFRGTSPVVFPVPRKGSQVSLLSGSNVQNGKVQMSTIKIWNYAKSEREIREHMRSDCFPGPSSSSPSGRPTTRNPISTTVTPTSVPSESQSPSTSSFPTSVPVCPDDDNFRFERNEAQDCSWAGKDRDDRCYFQWAGASVKDYCPTSCLSRIDHCCYNSPSFRLDGKSGMDCIWVGQNGGNYCGVEMKNKFGVGFVSDQCPISCGTGCGCPSLWLGSTTKKKELSAMHIYANKVTSAYKGGFSKKHISLAVDPTDGVLYTVLERDGSNQLGRVEVHPKKGKTKVIVVGSTGIDNLDKLAIDSTGSMYGMGGTKLYSVDKDTGQTCFVAEFDNLSSIINDIAFNDQDELLAIDNENNILVIDIRTESITVRGSILLGSAAGDITFLVQDSSTTTTGSHTNNMLFGIGQDPNKPNTFQLFTLTFDGSNTFTVALQVKDLKIENLRGAVIFCQGS